MLQLSKAQQFFFDMLLIYSGGLYMLYQLHDFILSETQG
jgi:hypothetical protein